MNELVIRYNEASCNEVAMIFVGNYTYRKRYCCIFKT